MAVTAEKITIVFLELFSRHCLVSWVRVPIMPLFYRANNTKSKLSIKAILKTKSVVTVLHLLPPFFGHMWTSSPGPGEHNQN